MRKFKTTIEITSEAENKGEAMEIAGEYLSGNLTSGVDMRCATKRIHQYAKPLIGIVAVSLILIISIVSITYLKPSKDFVGNFSGINAVQPSLKTSSTPAKDDFKKEWETKQTREALKHIKK